MIKSNKVNVLSILIYIYVFLIILSTNSVYNNLNKLNFHIPIILIGIQSLILIYCFFKNKIRRDKLFKSIIICILYEFLMIGFCLLNKPYNLLNYISRWLMITPLAFLHFTIIDKSCEFTKKICLAFIKIMVALSLVSIVFYILGPLTGLIKYSNLVNIHWGGDKFVKSYYNLYFTMQFFYSKYFSLPRNSGIFTEAPMFALSLVIAFCLAIMRKGVNKKDIAILFITIFSTMSTTAIIIV